MHPDVARLHEAIQSMDDRLTELRAAIDGDPERMRGVIVDALREAATDPTITRAIYETMARHAGDSLAQAIGRRVLTALTVLCVAAVMAWSLITGHVK
jgi:hypothetical protein